MLEKTIAKIFTIFWIIALVIGVCAISFVLINSIHQSYVDNHTYIENPMDDGKFCDVKSYERFGWDCIYLK